jgi:hypothetical protein
MRRDKLLRDGHADGFQLHTEVSGIEKMITRLQEELEQYANHKVRTLPVGKD